MVFPATKTVAVAEVTPIMAKHINNLEDKVGIDGDTNIASLDNMVWARLETTTFAVDHYDTGGNLGHHKAGVWSIDGVPVTADASELNKLDGFLGTTANLNTLTAGPASDASALHKHGTSGYILIVDEKPANTDGGTFTNGAWRTRNLTAIKHDDTGSVILAGNQFTLPAGTYICDVVAPALDVNSHKAKLQNITDAITQLVGSSASAGNVDNDESVSFVRGVFTIAAPKVFEVQHRCQTTNATVGFGRKSNVGEVEIYTQVALTKVS